MKLAFFALVLGFGTGACVAEDPTTSDRLGSEVTDFTVANEAEIPTDQGETGDFAVVTITGVEIPGRTPTTETFDFTNQLEAEIAPQTRELCAQADQLPDSDVCSLICNPTGISAKLFDQGATGDCKSQQCALPGDITVSFDVCVGS